MQEFLVVFGPPAVGKMTVAYALSEIVLVFGWKTVAGET